MTFVSEKDAGTMNNDHPRSFAWVARNGLLFPQIIYEDPRVGCEGLAPVSERQLLPGEHHLTLDQLAAKYPAPAQDEEVT